MTTATSLTKTKTQREAIREAAIAAKEEASTRDARATAVVLLFSGDSLIFTAEPTGKVTRHTEAGWIRSGHRFASRRTAGIAQ